MRPSEHWDKETGKPEAWRQPMPPLLHLRAVAACPPPRAACPTLLSSAAGQRTTDGCPSVAHWHSCNVELGLRVCIPLLTQNESETRRVISVLAKPEAWQRDRLCLQAGGSAASGSLARMLGHRRHLPEGTGDYFYWETFLNNWKRKQETAALWTGARSVLTHLLLLGRPPLGSGN